MPDLGKVCVNAGHGQLNSGGFDTGAIGPSGLQEAKVALEVAGLVEKSLHQAGWRTLLIQDGDLDDIVQKSSAFQADYFISVHCNAFADHSAHGVETYAYLPGGQGQAIAKSIQARLAAATGLADRGVKFANFYVLKYTLCPAVLVEIGFITNPAEERLMTEQEFKSKVALAISEGFNQAVKKGAK
jgi:N-acetylmuramoyl-L-alanine amidase